MFYRCAARNPIRRALWLHYQSPFFWRPGSDGHGDDGCSTTFWRSHFFDRNGTLTPKDRYLFRWVETCWNHQSESMGDFARCHGQPGTSLDLVLDLAGVWTVSSLSRSRLTTRQPEVGRMENDGKRVFRPWLWHCDSFIWFYNILYWRFPEMRVPQ